MRAPSANDVAATACEGRLSRVYQLHVCNAVVFAQVARCFGDGSTRGGRTPPRRSALLVMFWLCFRYIPNNSVGVVEKLWSPGGSVPEGQIIALDGEAGYQAELLRGGMHFGYWRWQYRVHKVRLVTISQGKIGYVYARDGEPLRRARRLAGASSATTSRTPARSSWATSKRTATRTRGQRGRQRAILREGVYAINPAVFVVIAEDHVFALPAIQSRQELQTIEQFRGELDEHRRVRSGRDRRRRCESVDPHEPDVPDDGRLDRHRHGARRPVAAAGRDHRADRRQRVARAELPQQLPGRRSVPACRRPPRPPVPDAHRRHLLHQPLVRHAGDDSENGRADRLRRRGGELRRPARPGPVRQGVPPRRAGRRPASAACGKSALGPGKYAFNTYAGSIILVPTTNFVLHWITGKSESHRYDESLRSIDLVTKDAYEPLLPL